VGLRGRASSDGARLLAGAAASVGRDDAALPRRVRGRARPRGQARRAGRGRGVGASGQEFTGAGAADAGRAAGLHARVEPCGAAVAAGQRGRGEPHARELGLAGGGGLRALSKNHGHTSRGADELPLVADHMTYLNPFGKLVLDTENVRQSL
jgi:hypothetical protein